MNFADYPDFLFERRGGVITVTLNNPDQRNAITPRMDTALPRLIVDLDDDLESNVIVITGAGEAFCAGGDVAGMQAGLDNIDHFLVGYRNGKRLLHAMLDCGKPIIAKVNGDAIGLGATIALFSDIVIASEKARFADPHVKVGIAAGDGGAVIWPLNVGYAAAKYFLLTGDLVNARDAQQMGLIARVVAADELDEATDKLADRMANGASQAIQYSKAVLNIGLRQQLAASVDAGFALETISSRHPDHREAATAFVEKRKPKFGK